MEAAWCMRMRLCRGRELTGCKLTVGIGLRVLATALALLLLPCGRTGAIAASAPAIQVWFAPASESLDFLDLFRHPNLWSKARSQISVFQFAPQQLGGPTNGPHVNTIAELKQVHAFELLKSWGIDIALEAPAIKEWNCNGDTAANLTLQVIGFAHAAGGEVKYVTMDEPLLSGTGACRQTIVETAEKTSVYIKKLTGADPSLRVGDVEPYPIRSVTQLEQWILALSDQGTKPAHFHLDVDTNFLKTHPQLDASADFQSLKRFLQGRGIPFGIIFWSGHDPEPSDRTYFDHAMGWVKQVHAAIGAPDNAIFESWVARSYPGCPDTSPQCSPPRLACPTPNLDGCGRQSVPANLPVARQADFSHTRLVGDALVILR